MKMKSKGMFINDVTFLGARTRNFLNTSDAIEIKIEFADPNSSIKIAIKTSGQFVELENLIYIENNENIYLNWYLNGYVMALLVPFLLCL